MEYLLSGPMCIQSFRGEDLQVVKRRLLWEKEVEIKRQIWEYLLYIRKALEEAIIV